jgi:hypothetical protein
MTNAIVRGILIGLGCSIFMTLTRAVTEMVYEECSLETRNGAWTILTMVLVVIVFLLIKAR